MNEKAKQPYKDIREHLKDSNFNNVVMEAFELMCGEIVEMDLQFDNYPMAHTKYCETEASKKSIEFSKKYHGTSVVVKLALEQREELLKWKDSQQDLIKSKDEYIAKLCNDRAELKEHEKELIAEQHRLFDLAKEQEETIAQLTEADYYFITSMALDMLKSNSNFALMYIDNIFCLVDTKSNSFEVIDNYDIDTENIGKSKCQELNELKEFAKVLCKMKIVDTNHKIYGIDENDIALIKKAVEKYGE